MLFRETHKIQTSSATFGLGAGLLVLLFALVANASCGAASYPPTGPASVENVAVGRLQTLEGNFRCTAWKVSESYVMTAGHCCEVDGIYTMEGPYAPPGELYTVSVDDDEHDVCVLSGIMLGDPIKIVEHDPAPGDPVWTLGYPRNSF